MRGMAAGEGTKRKWEREKLTRASRISTVPPSSAAVLLARTLPRHGPEVQR